MLRHNKLEFFVTNNHSQPSLKFKCETLAEHPYGTHTAVLDCVVFFAGYKRSSLFCKRVVEEESIMALPIGCNVSYFLSKKVFLTPKKKFRR